MKPHTGKCNGTQQQLPLRGLLDITVVDDTGDNGAREDPVWEGHLAEM